MLRPTRRHLAGIAHKPRVALFFAFVASFFAGNIDSLQVIRAGFVQKDYGFGCFHLRIKQAFLFVSPVAGPPLQQVKCRARNTVVAIIPPLLHPVPNQHHQGKFIAADVCLRLFQNGFLRCPFLNFISRREHDGRTAALLAPGLLAFPDEPKLRRFSERRIQDWFLMRSIELIEQRKTNSHSRLENPEKWSGHSLSNRRNQCLRQTTQNALSLSLSAVGICLSPEPNRSIAF